MDQDSGVIRPAVTRERLTAGRIRTFECGPDSRQAFLWDSDAPGLAVRATRGSTKKAFIFQSKCAGKTLRSTIGDVRVWGIDEARAEARRLRTLIDQGVDPRQQRKDEVVAREQIEAKAVLREVTVAVAWDAYIVARQGRWGARTLADHKAVTKPGGEPWFRGRRGGATKTQPGELTPLLSLRLAELTAERVKDWLAVEVASRPTRAALAFRLLRAFVRWCGEQDAYQDIISTDACSKRFVRELIPKARAKQDALLREQLPGWFSAVRAIPNPVISAYLQSLLLTGARREELAGLRWQDVDFRWKRILIRDKAETAKWGEGEGFRTIPLTPYVARLLGALPRRVGKESGESVENPWVFSSPNAESGRLQDPSDAHRSACASAGIVGLTLHGLRRSFGSLAEWLEIPAGVVAQIQGHKPSATAEKHYRVRPVDLLAVGHNKLEAWILEQAGICIDADSDEATLRKVAP